MGNIILKTMPVFGYAYSALQKQIITCCIVTVDISNIYAETPWVVPCALAGNVHHSPPHWLPAGAIINRCSSDFHSRLYYSTMYAKVITTGFTFWDWHCAAAVWLNKCDRLLDEFVLANVATKHTGAEHILHVTKVGKFLCYILLLFLLLALLVLCHCCKIFPHQL